MFAVKTIHILVVTLLFTLPCVGQNNLACPVISTLAAVKLGDKGKPTAGAENKTVIWYTNQSRKAIRGVQFRLLMLDGVGNKYPAKTMLVSTGEVQPQKGDMLLVDNTGEQEFFGERWELIEGVEVQVIRVMYTDLTVFVPRRPTQCSAKFMNDDYQSTLDRWWRAKCSDPATKADLGSFCSQYK
jgi:hypothetical protein